MGEQKWENGLCECESCGLCLGSTFCPCFVFGRTAQRINNFPADDHGSDGNGDCLIYGLTLCVGVPWIPLWLRRSEIRKRFNIAGNGCTDCLVSCCCHCCALAQMHGEIKKKARQEVAGNPNAGYVGHDDKMQYQAPPPAPATTY